MKILLHRYTDYFRHTASTLLNFIYRKQLYITTDIPVGDGGTPSPTGAERRVNMLVGYNGCYEIEFVRRNR